MAMAASSIEQSTTSFEMMNLLDQQEDGETLKQCLNEIIRCENQQQCCRNALKRLEFEICPRLKDDVIFDVLTKSSIIVDNEKSSSNNKALDDILLSILSSDDYVEICRERACTCLKSLLCRLMLFEGEETADYYEGVTPRPCGNKEAVLLLGYAQSFLTKFIPICTNRISSTIIPSRSTNTGGGMMGERSEEIRLLLIQIVLLVVQGFGSYGTNLSLVTNEELDTAVSTLCRQLPKTSLLDPFPELKQESCNLIKALCRVFPHCVEKHAETLITPLVGTSIPNLNGEKAVEESESMMDAATTIERHLACRPMTGTCSNTLLRHRHSKIRCIALETVASIIECKRRYVYRGETYHDLDGVVDRILFQVLPNVEPLCPFDKIQSVRIKLSQMVCSQLGLLLEDLVEEDSNDLEPSLVLKRTVTSRLLVLYLLCVSDESETVKDTAEQHGRELVSRCHLGDYGVSKLIRRFASSILHILLHRIEHGKTAEHKKRYLDAFSSMLNQLLVSSATVGEQVECELVPICFHSEMKLIVSILCDAFSTEDKIVYESAIQAAASLGRNSETQKSAMDIILASICGRSNEIENTISLQADRRSETRRLLLSSPRHFSTMLCITSGLLRGVLSSSKDHIQIDDLTGMMKISQSIAGEKIIKAVYDSEDAAFSLLDVLEVIAVLCKNCMASYETHSYMMDIIVQNNLFCCMHLLGCKHNVQLATSTHSLIAFIGTNNVTSDVASPVSSDLAQSNLEKYFPNILSMILQDLKNEDDRDTWAYGNPGMFAFDAFLRVNNTSCISKHFHLIAPVFESHLRDGSQRQGEMNEDYLQKKLFFMALLESLFSSADEKNADTMRDFVERLICNAILPNLIWQSGGLASSLRKVSIAVLYSMLGGVRVTKVMLYKFAPSLLPILRSTLQDDDGTTRELATAVLAKIFTLLPNSLGEEAVHQFYPDLLRGLDDSDERVRFVTCEVIIAFLGSSPLNYLKGEILENIADGLFLHLDDPNPLFQEKVLEVISAASKIDLHAIKRIARKSSSTSSRCGMLFLG